MSLYFAVAVSFCLVALTIGRDVNYGGQSDSSIPTEKWGYVDTRAHARMFWWFYAARDMEAIGGTRLPKDMPLVLWLQGGPGASGAGFGNFEEIGPLDAQLKARSATWLRAANVLFIDNPVGAGFSYVSDPSAFTRNISQISADLLTVMQAFVGSIPAFSELPFYIFCESYGGKMTAHFGATLVKAIQQKEILLNFKGVALGDSWISPVDSVLTWAPYLYQFNLLDDMDFDKVQAVAQACAKAVASGNLTHATDLWAETEDIISECTDGVNVYNVLQHNAPPDLRAIGRSSVERLATRHLSIYQSEPLATFMDTQVREKLNFYSKIIPDNVRWGSQSADVFKYQSGDFMRDVVKEVDTLLSANVRVVVFQGQLDMICDTAGAELWLGRLQWPHLDDFMEAKRKPLYVASHGRDTQAFLKTFENLSLFYIMNAGHMVPKDNPEMALKMLRMVVGGE